MTILVGWTHHQNLKLAQFHLIKEDITHNLSTKTGDQVIICAKAFLPVHTYSTNEVIIAVIGYPYIVPKKPTQEETNHSIAEIIYNRYSQHGTLFIEQLKGEVQLIYYRLIRGLSSPLFR